MNSSSRFTDNNNGTITDNKTGLTWTKEDTWQSEAKWVSWDEAKDHIMHLFQTNYCGNGDWRFPTTEEVLSLYDTDVVNTDKYGSVIHLDPIFPSGCLPTVWTDGHFSGNEGFILDFRNGEIRSLYKSKSGRMAVRAVYDKSKSN
jgi:uncharacterized protein DUF1566